MQRASIWRLAVGLPVVCLLFRKSFNFAEEEDEIPSEFLVNRQTLTDLCMEAKKLKNLAATDKITSDMKRISKLLTILEKNIRDTTQQEQAGTLLTFFDDVSVV